MITSLFFLILLAPSMLLAQEVASASKTDVPVQSEVASSSQVATPLSGTAPASEVTVLPAGETNSASPAAVPTSPVGTDSVTPVDPSGEASPESTSATPAALAEEGAAGIDTNAPASDQAEEPLKAPLEKAPESIGKKEEQIKIRYYQVRTQVEHDPEVAAIKKQAVTAVSEEKKRQVLRAYYELLFKKMKGIDVSISDRCDVMQAAYLRRLEQATVEPTIPVVPFVNPSGSTEKKETTAVPAVNISKKKKSHLSGNSD